MRVAMLMAGTQIFCQTELVARPCDGSVYDYGLNLVRGQTGRILGRVSQLNGTRTSGQIL